MINFVVRSNRSVAKPIARWWRAACLLVLCFASAPLIDRVLTLAARQLNNPYPNDGIEGTLLYEARILSSGQALYQPLAPDRFVSAPYPPIYLALVGLSDRLFPAGHAFWQGRLVSALAALGIASLIVLIAYQLGRCWQAGVLGAVVFLSAPPVILWGTRIKPDLLAIFLSTFGLYLATYCFARRESASQQPAAEPLVHPALAGAAVCFTLAFFTKQTTLMAALATGLALLIDDLAAYLGHARAGRIGAPFRRTIAFGLLLLGMILATWASCDLATAGQFTAHVWGLHRSEWWSMYLVRKYTLRLTPYWPALVLAIPLLLWAARNRRALPLACYFVVAPITLLGAAEISANHNHLLESILALSLASAGALAIASQSKARIWFSLLVFGLFALQLRFVYQPHPLYKGEFRLHDSPARFVHFIRNTPGEILSDDVGLLILSGKPIRYDDPSTIGPAARYGIWDQSGLVREIAERRFSAILLDDRIDKDPPDGIGRWTSEMRAAIRAHYQLKFHDQLNVYVPNPDAQQAATSEPP